MELAGGRLLAVIPHPDDEAYSMAGTLALCAASGAQIKMICATRGEAGNDLRGVATNKDDYGAFSNITTIYIVWEAAAARFNNGGSLTYKVRALLPPGPPGPSLAGPPSPTLADPPSLILAATGRDHRRLRVRRHLRLREKVTTPLSIWS